MQLFKRMAGLVLLASAPLIASGPVQAETQLIRFSNPLPPAHFIVKEMFVPWAEQVEEVTDGRVKIEFINPLGKPQAHHDLVRNGVADMGFSVHGYTASRFPLIEFAELPFTTDDGGINSVAYWRTYDKFMKEAGEHRGVKLLGLWTSPPSVIFTDKEEITGLDDLQGLKLRSPSPLFDSISDTLNIVTVNAPAPESYEMLSRGVIDGMYFQNDQIENFKLDQFIKSSLSAPGGLGKSSQYLFMNERVWNSIGEDDRAAIEAISGEAVARTFGGKWQASENKAIEQLKEAGLNNYVVEGEELETLKNRLAYIEENWIEAADKKGVDGKAALEYYRAQIQELEAEAQEQAQAQAQAQD